MQNCGTVLLLALLGSQAGALCKEPRPRLVCAEYFHSKAVVIARLAGVTAVKDSYDDVAGTYYSMIVEQTLGGQIPRLFRIYEGNDSGRARFDWKAGDSYLLFLLGENLNGGWVIDGCGNSGPLEQRQTILQQVKAIDSTSDRALIQGSVGGISIGFPLAGIRIEARGPGGVSNTKTGSDGRFELHVAPGKYKVQVFDPGKTFMPADITYEDPNALVLETGSCAQVQFVESSQQH